MEEAVADLDKAQVEAAILKAAETATSPRMGTSLTDTGVMQTGDVAPHEAGVWPIGDSGNGDDLQAGIVPVGGENFTRTPSMGVREITNSAPEGGTGWELVSIERNPAFADVTYQFPVTTMTVQQPSIDLSEIGDDTINQAARRVTSAGDVLLRKEIIAMLGKKLRAEDRESAEVDSVHVDDDDAKNALVKLVLNMPLVPKTEQTARYVATFLVPKFMQSVMFSGWTVKSLDSARTELLKLIQNYTVETLRSTREVPSIHPKPMPSNGYTLPLGQKVHDQIETREQFVRGQVYGGWFKSLFAEESFDSFTGEYQLARLLNTSPGIVWWHRLHPQDQAFVFYNAKDRYFPDFVAMDVNGVHWIIEGKSERGRDDAQVQAKRKAAEALVRRLVAEDAYADQLWGYLIAYEQDTARADSWEDLKAFTSPVNNAL